ncbi:MAG TPA: hypothetical protein VHX63_02615 [Acidobacteriaceae bacterium]|nr:hypothetical protein [Acidobacteriaceae bacterium]
MTASIMAWGMMAWGQAPLSRAQTANAPAVHTRRLCCAQLSRRSRSARPSPEESDDAAVSEDLDSCRIYKVQSLPGSHEFASDFIETMASDPNPRARDANVVWGVTADLDSKVPARERAIYISKSSDGGKQWTPVARIRAKYFDAKIAEGLRNGFVVAPGGTDFVITTQRGAFQVFPRSNPSAAVVRSIAGPRVPRVRPQVTIPKKTGDPVRAGVVVMTADGRHMIVAYGYFDLNPQLFTYHKSRRGLWIKDGTLPHLPTDLDIFSMQFDHPRNPHPGALYVGTGDQAYRLDLHTMQWTRVDGVGPDSAIHGMSTVGGLHLAACWGVYNPVSAEVVKRVTEASFLLHPGKDVAGPNIRAYGIEVDPRRPSREVLTTITGVYVSSDSGESWRRLNDLPEGEFHSAHFNADGTVLVSGYAGTFVTNPFSNTCTQRLRTRGQ